MKYFILYGIIVIKIHKVLDIMIRHKENIDNMYCKWTDKHKHRVWIYAKYILIWCSSKKEFRNKSIEA